MNSHVRRIDEILTSHIWDVRPDGAGTPAVGITEVTESDHRSGTSTVVVSAAADGYDVIGQEASGVQPRRMLVRGSRCIARACRTRSADSWCRHGMLGGLGWSVHVCYPLTASRSVFPALNDGAVAAAMAMLSPVRGFLPRRAGRCLAVNVPKPAMVTGSPRARASPMAVIMAPITRSAADLGKDACPATSAASSDRFQARVVRHLYAVLRRRQQRRSRSTRSSASTSARTCIYGHLAECNANAPAVSHLEIDDNVSGREHELGQPRHARSVMCALALQTVPREMGSTKKCGVQTRAGR